MNRLYNTSFYLAGPMDRAIDNGEKWRRWITPYLENLGIIVCDPSNKPINKGCESQNDRLRWKQLLEDEKYEEFGKEVKLLRVIDLRLVDLTDCTICYLDPNIHMCGSYEEVFHANITKKPILTCVEGGKKKAPGWMFGTIPHQHIFGDFESLLEYVNYIDSSEEEPPHFKRWTWFKYDMMLPKRPYGTQNDGKRYKMTWEEI